MILMKTEYSNRTDTLQVMERVGSLFIHLFAFVVYDRGFSLCSNRRIF